MMEPLQSSYQKSANDVGRPRASDEDISGSGERTRDVSDDSI